MTQKQALQVLMDGKSVFLTGPPGAGKTYVLNRFIALARKSGKRVAVTASTGIAATHIGGVTIHSWSGLGIKDHVTDQDLARFAATSKLVKRYNATDILIVDEISMLHGARLDAINAVAKRLRESGEPFGGLQVVLVGDLYQLPPITRGRDMPDFAHLSDSWAELRPHICYLTEQHRVSAGDALLDLLSAMRRGEVNEMHEAALSERLEMKPASDVVVTRLFTHNVDVDAINAEQLKALGGDAKTYTMTLHGNQTRAEQLMQAVLAPQYLTLKIGAEVMFVANNFAEGYVNGSRGTVINFVGNLPIVALNSGKEIKVEPSSWKYEEDGRTIAEVAQLPLRLAWAITIHKSQGMSLDGAVIDLSRSFSPGMGYVALSRVRSMEGVYLTGVNNLALTMHPLIHEYDGELREVSEALAHITTEYDETTAVDGSAIDPVLLQALKDWRTAQAKNAELPPYMIAHDSLLEELAKVKPTTSQQLMGIKGLGPMKIEKFGPELIDIIKK